MFLFIVEVGKGFVYPLLLLFCIRLCIDFVCYVVL